MKSKTLIYTSENHDFSKERTKSIFSFSSVVNGNICTKISNIPRLIVPPTPYWHTEYKLGLHELAEIIRGPIKDWYLLPREKSEMNQWRHVQHCVLLHFGILSTLSDHEIIKIYELNVCILSGVEFLRSV